MQSAVSDFTCGSPSCCLLLPSKEMLLCRGRVGEGSWPALVGVPTAPLLLPALLSVQVCSTWTQTLGEEGAAQGLEQAFILMCCEDDGLHQSHDNHHLLSRVTLVNTS